MNRTSTRARSTKETKVELSVSLDGAGAADVSTGLPFFDHMLDQLGRHSGLDLFVRAEGDLAVDADATRAAVTGACARIAQGRTENILCLDSLPRAVHCE